jgi:hypothetical protein
MIMNKFINRCSIIYIIHDDVNSNIFGLIILKIDDHQ